MLELTKEEKLIIINSTIENLKRQKFQLELELIAKLVPIDALPQIKERILRIRNAFSELETKKNEIEAL